MLSLDHIATIDGSAVPTFDFVRVARGGSASSNVVSIDTARVRRLVAELPKLHRLIIGWRYGLDGLTLSRHEIADRLRLSPAVVCMTEREALRLLRDRALNPQNEREAA
jgi:DNA-directed RNA polymerase specialized sigma subunit